MGRPFQPRGLCLALLGSDGAGKSTLLARLQILLAPRFPGQFVLHFRPGLFQKRTTGVVTNPHAQPPRNLLLSWLKVGYYFADHWAGWLVIVLPAKMSGKLVIFDRNFDDLLVDEKRYRLRGTKTLVRVLRRLLPGADRTLVLSAPAAVLHQRKPELSLAELEKQQGILRELAAKGAPYVLISAEPPSEQVADAACREVSLFLAQREERRS
jgi:thymidylate kinase